MSFCHGVLITVKKGKIIYEKIGGKVGVFGSGDSKL